MVGRKEEEEESQEPLRAARAQTCGHGRLELVAGELTPADGVDVRGLTVYPLVILAVPAIKVDAEETVHHPLHSGHTDEPGLHEVHGLQLHAHLETMVGAVLGGGTKAMTKPARALPQRGRPGGGSRAEHACGGRFL